MAAQDTRTVTVPRQAGPSDPPLAPLSSPAAPPQAAAPAPLIGRDRPLHKEERHFLIGIAGVFGVLAVFIVTFLLLAEYVWS